MESSAESHSGKTWKNFHESTSFWSVSLLSILTNSRLTFSHQFDFREKHRTVGQTHRIIQIVSNILEEQNYCSAAFIDIPKAFDKVWHHGLLSSSATRIKQRLIFSGPKKIKSTTGHSSASLDTQHLSDASAYNSVVAWKCSTHLFGWDAPTNLVGIGWPCLVYS